MSGSKSKRKKPKKLYQKRKFGSEELVSHKQLAKYPTKMLATEAAERKRNRGRKARVVPCATGHRVFYSVKQKSSVGKYLKKKKK